MNTTPRRESIIDEVARARDLASHLHILLRHNSPPGADELSEGLLQSLTAALSVLNPNSSSSTTYTMKRKEEERNCKGSQSQSSRNPISSGNSCSKTTELTSSPYYDGHEWRKYGQKDIRGTHFPRCYYRCTYEDKQGCKATKQVQQKNSNDPPLFEVIYAKQHICKSLFIIPQPQFDGGTTELKPEKFSFSSYSFPPTEHEPTSTGQGHNGNPVLGQNNTPFSGCTISPDSTSSEISDSDIELLRALLAPAPDFTMSCL